MRTRSQAATSNNDAAKSKRVAAAIRQRKGTVAARGVKTEGVDAKEKVKLTNNAPGSSVNANATNAGCHGGDESNKKMPAVAAAALNAAMKKDWEEEALVILSSDDEDDDKSVTFCGYTPYYPSLEEQQRALDARKKQEFEWMKNSHAGRSVLFVDRVLQLLKPHDGLIDPVGKDDAVFLAQQMLTLQDEFKADKRPTHVSIGYHYTLKQNLNSIRTDGLLTIEDRSATKNPNKQNRAYFGNGVYTGTSK